MYLPILPLEPDFQYDHSIIFLPGGKLSSTSKSRFDCLIALTNVLCSIDGVYEDYESTRI